MGKNEDVLFEVHPHWIVLLEPAAAVVVACAASIAGVVLLSNVPLWLGIVMLVVVGTTMLRFLWCCLEQKAATVTLTPARLRWSEGVAVRRAQDFQLARLNDTSVDQSVMGRILGFGTLIVETGGEQSEKVFPRYPRPGWMQDQINDAISKIVRSVSD
ncbi:MAG: PH domain-containing protein [Actinobacteria bacterium]|nr:PH domain-containing protein [Actinomycetota bacterium]